jgi:hypothetical protein
MIYENNSFKISISLQLMEFKVYKSIQFCGKCLILVVIFVMQYSYKLKHTLYLQKQIGDWLSWDTVFYG